jgi:hypothetical protein
MLQAVQVVVGMALASAVVMLVVVVVDIAVFS